MQRFPFLLAWRYLRAGSREQSIGSMIGICILASALGACALTLVACIMQGFEQATHRALQSINPSMVIRGNGHALNYEKIRHILNQNFPEIIASAPTSTHYALIKDDTATALGTVLAIKGIDPVKEPYVTTLARTIALPHNQTLFNVLQKNHLIIGKKLAEQQQLKTGDTIHLISIVNKNGKLQLNETDAIISGFFSTGIEEADQGMALAHIDFTHELFPEIGITEIGLAMHRSVNPVKLAQRLRQRFSLEVLPWHEQYPALVSALKLEKYAAFLVIALISLVASMSIISLLFMYITHKRRDIALLMTCGLAGHAIRRIFLCIGAFIGIIGALGGTLLAWLVGIIIKHYACIKLPDIYYTDTLPIDLDPTIFILVFVVTVLMSTVASLIPLKQISRINCADVLRFEG